METNFSFLLQERKISKGYSCRVFMKKCGKANCFDHASENVFRHWDSWMCLCVYPSSLPGPCCSQWRPTDTSQALLLTPCPLESPADPYKPVTTSEWVGPELLVVVFFPYLSSLCKGLQMILMGSQG